MLQSTSFSFFFLPPFPPFVHTPLPPSLPKNLISFVFSLLSNIVRLAFCLTALGFFIILQVHSRTFTHLLSLAAVNGQQQKRLLVFI